MDSFKSSSNKVSNGYILIDINKLVKYDTTECNTNTKLWKDIFYRKCTKDITQLPV